MNHTKASCGHMVPAIGMDGSAARAECEILPCSACRRFAVVTVHGEGATVYHVVDRHAPEGEQPAILASYTTADRNGGAYSQAEYRALCLEGFGYKGPKRKAGAW